MFNFVKFVVTKNGMGKNQDSGWVKIRIRDKLPGSATLRSGTEINILDSKS